MSLITVRLDGTGMVDSAESNYCCASVSLEGKNGAWRLTIGESGSFVVINIVNNLAFIHESNGVEMVQTKQKVTA